MRPMPGPPGARRGAPGGLACGDFAAPWNCTALLLLMLSSSLCSDSSNRIWLSCSTVSWARRAACAASAASSASCVRRSSSTCSSSPASPAASSSSSPSWPLLSPPSPSSPSPSSSSFFLSSDINFPSSPPGLVAAARREACCAWRARTSRRCSWSSRSALANANCACMLDNPTSPPDALVLARDAPKLPSSPAMTEVSARLEMAESRSSTTAIGFRCVLSRRSWQVFRTSLIIWTLSSRKASFALRDSSVSFSTRSRFFSKTSEKSWPATATSAASAPDSWMACASTSKS
mmetsp:Transcript_39956/g.105294  ORF Transcript_39956/g.105294 Transcript_39956/m.105294 type:complete len:291 (-) Transcript_39956:184-1056(-)